MPKTYAASGDVYKRQVAVGAAVDYLLRGAVIGAGITLDVKLFFGMLVTVWLTDVYKRQG